MSQSSGTAQSVGWDAQSAGKPAPEDVTAVPLSSAGRSHGQCSHSARCVGDCAGLSLSLTMAEHRRRAADTERTVSLHLLWLQQEFPAAADSCHHSLGCAQCQQFPPAQEESRRFCLGVGSTKAQTKAGTLSIAGTGAAGVQEADLHLTSALTSP